MSVREALTAALAALETAQLHHGATSLPLAIQRFGSSERCSEIGKQTWTENVPTAIVACRAALKALPSAGSEPDVEPEESFSALEIMHAWGHGVGNSELVQRMRSKREAMGYTQPLQVTQDMRDAVRFAPNSAHWSAELVKFFGPQAREGIDGLQAQLIEAYGTIEALQKAHRGRTGDC